jgi:hypothetical protein
VDPSSLVFLAIIGVWAAYLVPTWLRRRVHLAQSRARDRFSAGARVLHRRRVVRAAGHRSSSAVLTAGAAGDTAAGDSATAGDGAAEFVEPVAAAATASRLGEAERARARSMQREAHIAHAGVVERARLAAARRARVMVALLLFTGAAWAVSVTTASPIWVAVPPSVMLLVHVLAARLAAVRSRRTLAVSRQRLAEARRRSEAAVPVPAEPAAPAAVETPAAVVAEEPAAAVGGEPWMPVPVPPPTYTLKPVVPRPEPAPLPEPVAPAAPAASAGRVARGALPRRPEEVERILDLDAAETRRVVNG